MNRSRILLLLVAVMAGGTAAYLATREPPAPPEPPPAATTLVVQEARTQVLVARQAIGVGERLTPAALEWVDWPEAAVRAEYITSQALPAAMTEMSGSVARFEFFAGEPIREQKLTKPGQGYLSAILESGKRAVSVSVSPASASGGFIVPNDRVDVVLTRSAAAGQISDTVLHNVRVLAINSRLGEAGTTGAPSDPGNPRAEMFYEEAIATLELDAAEAEVIINATAIGTLALVLRSTVDMAESAGLETRAVNEAIRISSPFWTNNSQGSE